MFEIVVGLRYVRDVLVGWRYRYDVWVDGVGDWLYVRINRLMRLSADD